MAEWFFKMWAKLVTRIESVQDHENDDEIDFWRDKLFSKILIFSVTLGSIALISSIIASLINELITLAILDVVVYCLILFIAFNRKIASTLKKKLFLGGLYFIAIILFWNLQDYWAPAVLFLFAITIIASLILSSKSIFTVIGLNCIVCFVFWLTLFHEKEIDEQIAFVAVFSNLTFLSGACAAAISSMSKSLANTLSNERESRLAVEKSAKVLERQKEELEQFIFIASHDLREPIVNLEAISTLLKDASFDASVEERKKIITMLPHPIEEMKSKVSGLLRYSMIGTSGNLELINTKKLLNKICIELKSQIEETNANLVVNDLLNIHGYSLEIERLFYHLISNSLKFRNIDKSLQIEISSEQAEGWNYFHIKDNGIGISKQLQEKVFQIFQVGHSVAEGNGMGLGLSICRKVVELHEGKIWIEPTSEEVDGVVISFCLPSSLH